MSFIRNTAIAALAAAALLAPRAVWAADLGGDCCADLEERIAELEATAARKGNRKVTLTVSGQLNEAWSYVTFDDGSDNKITNNGNDDSFVRFAGSGKINPDLWAGYVLEINISQLGLLNTGLGGSEPEVRQSYWFIKSEKLGQVSLGRQSQATNDFDKFSTNDAWRAGKALSTGSLSDLYLTGLDLPFDGTYKSVLKYVSPDWAGFTLSATWGSTVGGAPLAIGGGKTGDGYDVALRFDSKDTVQDFKFKGAVGYRRSTDLDVDVLHILNLSVPTGDVDTVLVKGSVMHVPTGIFVDAEFADQKWQDAGFTLRGYDVTGGLHEKWNALGATEVFGSWGRVEVSDGGSGNVDYYGLGATQALDAAAMTLYLGWRHYDADDLGIGQVDAVNAGATIEF